MRIIQYNAELTDESVAYTSHVASASAKTLLTKVHYTYIHTYIHTYMKFITRCIVEDGLNQRHGLLLGGGV